MDGPVRAAVTEGPANLQRWSTGPATGTDVAPSSVHDTLARAGTPLEPTLRHDMEHRFHQDFSQVRVHRDADAQASARDVGASAYTVGNHMVFAAGRFDEHTHHGRQLIAHELVHVLQQGQRNPHSSGNWLQRAPQEPAPLSPRSRQVACVVRRGGCSSGTYSRDAGTADEDLPRLNALCRNEEKTGYAGDIRPTPDECNRPPKEPLSTAAQVILSALVVAGAAIAVAATIEAIPVLIAGASAGAVAVGEAATAGWVFYLSNAIVVNEIGLFAAGVLISCEGDVPGLLRAMASDPALAANMAFEVLVLKTQVQVGKDGPKRKASIPVRPVPPKPADKQLTFKTAGAPIFEEAPKSPVVPSSPAAKAAANPATPGMAPAKPASPSGGTRDIAPKGTAPIPGAPKVAVSPPVAGQRPQNREASEAEIPKTGVTPPVQGSTTPGSAPAKEARKSPGPGAAGTGKLSNAEPEIPKTAAPKAVPPAANPAEPETPTPAVVPQEAAPEAGSAKPGTPKAGAASPEAAAPAKGAVRSVEGLKQALQSNTDKIKALDESVKSLERQYDKANERAEAHQDKSEHAEALKHRQSATKLQGLIDKNRDERKRLASDNVVLADQLDRLATGFPTGVGPPPGSPHGGAYESMDAWGGERNHIPPDSVSKLAPTKGPALWMEKDDHAKTNSWGSGAKAIQWRDKQKALIKQGKVMEAIQMDVDDIRSKFKLPDGSCKYEKGINQLQTYAKGINPADFMME
jgi:hypothetical protein